MDDPGDRRWPRWWEWDLEIREHVLDRMIDRAFSEIDLRAMMESAKRIRQGHQPGRWIIETSHEFRPWKVVVEPDVVNHFLVVITAYPVDAT